jgi:hypothetical protein
MEGGLPDHRSAAGMKRIVSPVTKVERQSISMVVWICRRGGALAGRQLQRIPMAGRARRQSR